MSVTGMCWTDEEDQSLFLSMTVLIQFLYCGRNLQERNIIQAPQSILPFLSLKENTNWGGVRAMNVLVGCNGPEHLLLALLPFLSTWVKSTIATQFKASSPGLSCAVVIPVLRCLLLMLRWLEWPEPDFSPSLPDGFCTVFGTLYHQLGSTLLCCSTTPWFRPSLAVLSPWILSCLLSWNNPVSASPWHISSCQEIFSLRLLRIYFSYIKLTQIILPQFKTCSLQGFHMRLLLNWWCFILGVFFLIFFKNRIE